MAAESGARKERRVFFALWPDADALRRLDQAGRAAHLICGGRRMRRETLHLTLAFIGGIPSRRVAELEGLACSIRAQPFELTLDRLECLQRRRIVWIGAARIPGELRELADELHTRLRTAGFRTEERSFAAHVTLLRNSLCEGELPETAGVVWRVGEFVLVESELKPAGANYRILRRFGLKPAAAPVTRPPA